ncbi:PAS domain-containing sensor histidine kinase [Nitrosopumilus adriaticus]|uniref:sensor histidine kinase n=1 Tax=Nitrosopumilus adriaticus TaxID=1580092 RepID=UPI00352F0D41
MKPSLKITLLVITQIIIILASFLTLVSIENEKTNLGNLVNISGKTRFLALSAQLDFDHYVREDPSHTEIKVSLKELEKNILFIKDGGIVDRLYVASLPLKFHEQWNDMYFHFTNYEKEVLGFIESDEINQNQLVKIQSINDELIHSADTLTNSISSDLSVATSDLIYLQIFFAIINIVAHVGLIFLILRIFEAHQRELLKLEKFSNIGEMTASFVHDIRNPLTIIQHSSDILNARNSQHFSDSDKKAIEKTNQAIKRIDSHLTDTLDYLRERRIRKEHVKSSLLISNILESMLIPPSVQIIMPSKDLTINCDKFQFERVLTNLVKNSIESMSEKGKMVISIEEDEKNTIIKIMDSGMPIPPAEIDKLFEPLFTTKQEGTGLGLPICKNIVESHGGTIEYQDSPKSFIIKLPK